MLEPEQINKQGVIIPGRTTRLIQNELRVTWLAAQISGTPAALGPLASVFLTNALLPHSLPWFV